MGRSLPTKLNDMGIELILGARSESLPGTDVPGGGSVTLSSGQVLEADLIIPTVGSRAGTSLVGTLPGVERPADGRVKVDGLLRPSSLANVFAAGDMIAVGDAMTIVAISRQRPWLEKTLKARASGTPLAKVKPYAPWGAKAPILILLGPERGNAFMMVATLGDWVTRKMKGRDLFIGKYRKLLGKN